MEQLRALDPADWVTLVAAIPRAASHISRAGTIAERVAELIQWAESTTGPGLAIIVEVLENLRKARRGRKA